MMIPSCYARKMIAERGVVLRAINAQQERPLWTSRSSIAVSVEHGLSRSV